MPTVPNYGFPTEYSRNNYETMRRATGTHGRANKERHKNQEETRSQSGVRQKTSRTRTHVIDITSQKHE